MATVTVTRKLVNELVKLSTGHDMQGQDFSEFCKEWLAGKTQRNARSTLLKYRAVVQNFVASLPDSRRTAPVSSITTIEVRRFLDAETSSGKSAGMVNDARSILRSLFDAALDEDLILTNPVKKKLALPTEREQRLMFDDESVARLLATADTAWRGMILFGYQAGLRISDAAKLTWANIDLENRLLTYKSLKTKRVTRVPLHDDLIEYLTALDVSDDPKAPIFPALCQRKTSGVTGLSQFFLRLMARAKVGAEKGKVKHGKGRQLNLLTFHSFRHTFNSRLAHNGVSQDIRKLLVGHSSDSVNDIYTHMQDSQLAAAINSLTPKEKD